MSMNILGHFINFSTVVSQGGKYKVVQWFAKPLIFISFEHMLLSRGLKMVSDSEP